MTTTTKTKTVKDVCTWLAKTMAYVARSSEYDGWEDKTARTNVKDAISKLQKTVKKEVDLTSFTDEELAQLGFSRWSDDCGMRMIPLWAVKALRDGTKLYAIDGEVVIVGQDTIDNDERFGCIAYGIMPENKFICLVRGCKAHTQK